MPHLHQSLLAPRKHQVLALVVERVEDWGVTVDLLLKGVAVDGLEVLER